ncbi:MAG: hypothetical protein ACLRRT_07775 [Ruthenibacterium lactatiformans]
MAFIKKYAGTVLGAALLLALAVFGITYRNEIWAVLTQQDARDAFIAFVHDSGFLGLLAFLGLQVLQVVVAVLPGEPVELMAGLLYGTWGGLALCLLGVGLSSAAVYCCVRAAGARAIDASVLAKYHFLRDEAHVKFFLFLLFFIRARPRTCSSIWALPARQAPCVFSHLTLARIPSVITSTFAGSQFAEGSWDVSLVVFLATGAVAGLCVIFQDRILAGIAALKGKFSLEKHGDL